MTSTEPSVTRRRTGHSEMRREKPLLSAHMLEPEAQEVADATSGPPFLYEFGPDRARRVLDDLQAAPAALPEVDEKWITVPAAVGAVRVRIVKPLGARGGLPVVLYLHGGGWILGDARTHDRLVRELAVGAGAAVAFVEYDRSPEARYPVAIEQAYATAQWITRHGTAEGLDASRLAVAGDSVGGNMAAALTLMAKQRGDVRFVHQSLYYPVTDAAQDTASYREFADGPYLTAKAMAWFWDAYTTDPAQRAEITASPLRATLDDLAGLPPAFVIVDEIDVLRDEGEAYARRLTQAGVPTISVRYNGTLHDFMMLDPVRGTGAATAATGQATAVLKTALRGAHMTHQVVANAPAPESGDGPGPAFDGVRVRSATLRLDGTFQPPRLAVHGEVDYATLAPFAAALSSMIEQSSGDVWVDLAGLDFIDVGGLRALATAACRLGTQDRRLVLRSVAPFLAKLMNLVGWSQIPGLLMLVRSESPVNIPRHGRDAGARPARSSSSPHPLHRHRPGHESRPRGSTARPSTGRTP